MNKPWKPEGPGRGPRVVRRFNAPSTDERVSDLLNELKRDGWRRVCERKLVGGLFGREIRFARGNTMRSLIVSRVPGQAKLSLIEWPAEGRQAA